MKVSFMAGFGMDELLLPIRNGFREHGWEIQHIPFRAYDSDFGNHRMHDMIDADLTAFKPNLILTEKGQGLDLDFMRRIRDKFGVPLFFWYYDVTNDDFLIEKERFEMAKVHDHVFTATKASIPTYENVGVPANWLVPACDPTIHRLYSPQELTAGELEKYTVDIAMATTNCYPAREWPQQIFTRKQIVNALVASRLTNLALWGRGDAAYGWLDKRRGGDPSFAPYFRGWCKWVDLSKAYSCAKIVIGHSARPDVYCYFNGRIVEALGTGAFYICERWKGLEEVFEIGKDLVVYDTLEELTDKVKYYLEHEDERKEIAANGRKKIFEFCSSYKTIEKIIKYFKG